MTRRPACIAGDCDLRAVHGHHAVKAATIRRERGNPNDPRWIVPLCLVHHFNHEHGPANRKLPLTVLPDAVFEVARETFGAGRAYNELRRAYVGEDYRLDGLLFLHELERAA